MMRNREQNESTLPRERSRSQTTKSEIDDSEVDKFLDSWNKTTHPERIEPDKNTDFVLEDPRLVDEATDLFHLSYVFEAIENGKPIVCISDGLLELVKQHRSDALWKHWDYFFDKKSVDGVEEALQMRKAICKQLTFTIFKEATACFVPVFDHNKQITKYVGCFLIDQTGSLESQISFQNKVMSALEACFIVDGRFVELPVLTLADGFCAKTGYCQKEMLRASCLSFCGSATSKASMRELLHRRQQSAVSKTLILLYKKNGHPFHSVLFSFPISACISEYSKICTLLIAMVDVTVMQLETIQDYSLGRVIGAGASGAVRIAKARDNDDIVAVKIVDASRFRSISEIELVEDEISALSTLKHENIVNLHEVIFKDHFFYFIMDFAAGGSLAQYLRSKQDHCLQEEEAKRIFHQIISAVAYCHRRRVVHRDLKPENILRDEHGRIHVADFGLSAIAAPCSGLNTQCGTPEFIAPEVLSSSEYDGAMADIWSLGVILYEMLCGKLPFHGRSRSGLFSQIQRGVYSPLPGQFSSNLRDIVDQMLTKDPQERITMEELLIHPWLYNKHLQSMQQSRQFLAKSRGVTEEETPRQSLEAKKDSNVHESAKLTLGDWDEGEKLTALFLSENTTSDDDAISNAIVSGAYTRSPSVVIVRNHSSDLSNKLSDDLEALRLTERQKSESKATSKQAKSFKSNTGTVHILGNPKDIR